jgi:hypothetical protein
MMGGNRPRGPSHEYRWPGPDPGYRPRGPKYQRRPPGRKYE